MDRGEQPTPAGGRQQGGAAAGRVGDRGRDGHQERERVGRRQHAAARCAGCQHNRVYVSYGGTAVPGHACHATRNPTPLGPRPTPTLATY